MKNMRYNCPKCGHKQCETGEIYAAGSIMTKIFNIQNRKFTTLTCKKCTYTEFFKTDMKNINNVVDLFIG